MTRRPPACGPDIAELASATATEFRIRSRPVGDGITLMIRGAVTAASMLNARAAAKCLPADAGPLI